MSWYCHNAARMLKVKIKASLWSEWRELPHRVPLRQRLCGSWLLWTQQCCTRIKYVLSLLPSPLSVFTQMTLCTFLQVRMVNHVLVWPVRLCPMLVVLESLPGMLAAPNVVCRYTIDHENFAVKNFHQRPFLNTRNTSCNVRQPIPILFVKVWRKNWDYAKNLQAKYFTGENIPIYCNYCFALLIAKINLIYWEYYFMFSITCSVQDRANHVDLLGCRWICDSLNGQGDHAEEYSCSWIAVSIICWHNKAVKISH